MTSTILISLRYWIRNKDLRYQRVKGVRFYGVYNKLPGKFWGNTTGKSE